MPGTGALPGIKQPSSSSGAKGPDRRGGEGEAGLQLPRVGPPHSAGPGASRQGGRSDRDAAGSGGWQRGSKSSAGRVKGRGQNDRMSRGARRRALRAAEGEGGVRPASRVGRLLQEFGNREDWVSKTILKHKMVAVIQANVRGWLLRLRWWASPHKVVSDLHARIQSEAMAAQRMAEARRKLEIKLLTQKQKQKAASVVRILGAKGALGAAAKGGPGLKWNRLRANADIVIKEEQQQEQRGASEAPRHHDDEGSDFSDLEMEDLTAVKLRARTPPWQKVEQSQWVGQYNKLNQKLMRGNLDVLWDLDECEGRLEDVKVRRLQRDPAAAKRAEEEGRFDPSTQDLPAHLINDMLAERYLVKYARLGLLDQAKVPPKPAAAAAAAPSPQAASPPHAASPIQAAPGV